MLRTLIIIACAALAACGAADERKSAASHAPCPAFAVIVPGETHCGVGLSADGRLSLDQRPLLAGAPLIVTSGLERRASALQIYPSPGGRFLLVRGCEGDAINPGICWRAMILDREGEARDLTFRSRAGPTTQIIWSPDNARFALVEPMDGFVFLTLVNAETGAIASFPREGALQNFRLEDAAAIRWTSPTIVAAPVQVCSADTGLCEPAAERSFTAP